MVSSKCEVPKVFDNITLDELKPGMWVIVSYKDYYYIGQVIKLNPNASRPARIKSLKNPFGCHDNQPQEFESHKFWLWYLLKDIYRSPVVPQSVKDGKTEKWWYK